MLAHRRVPSRGVPGADLRPELGRQRGVRGRDLPRALPVAGHARLGVRLRRSRGAARSCSSRRRCWAATIPRGTRSERIHATAGDGTRVPISLVRRAGVAPATARARCCSRATAPTAYPYPAGFSSNRLSLLDRGVSVAIAHIRGGGELGKRWHDDGRMMNKRNTFTDFIAAADFLAKSGYTAPDRLVIEGGSAGGLLMGAVLNLRPDLLRGRGAAGALRGRDQHHAGRVAAAHGGRVRGVGQSEDPRAVRVHEELLPVHQPGRAAVPGACSSRPRSTTAR